MSRLRNNERNSYIIFLLTMPRLVDSSVKSVNGTKIFVKGDYKIFLIDMERIINISGKEDRK